MPPCERGNTKLRSSPSKSGAPEENATYLKLEKPRFLFLDGSGGAATAVVAAGASAVHAASSTDRPAVGACSSATSTALGDGGGGFHLSAGARPPSLSSSSSSSDDEFSGVVGGRAPAAHAASTPRSLAPGALVVRSCSPSCARPAPVPVAARLGRPSGLRAWVGQTARRPWSPSTKRQLSRLRWCIVRE
jgi:hypothetical protein